MMGYQLPWGAWGEDGIFQLCSSPPHQGERGGSVVECRTPEREVRGSRPTAAVLFPWARHFTPRKYWLITQEAMAPSRHDWKIVDWDVKPQHNQPTSPPPTREFSCRLLKIFFRNSMMVTRHAWSLLHLPKDWSFQVRSQRSPEEENFMGETTDTFVLQEKLRGSHMNPACVSHEK